MNLILTLAATLMQIIGAGYIVWHSYKAKVRIKDKTVLIDTTGDSVEALLEEVQSQFQTQLVGFI